MSRVSATCLGVYVAATAVAASLDMTDLAVAAGSIGVVHAGAILYQKFRLGRLLYHVMESLAHKLEFVPVQTSSDPTL
jgi:hypothetical protein